MARLRQILAMGLLGSIQVGNQKWQNPGKETALWYSQELIRKRHKDGEPKRISLTPMDWIFRTLGNLFKLPIHERHSRISKNGKETSVVVIVTKTFFPIVSVLPNHI